MTEPQGKLVRCLAGRVYDVAADLRTGSATFARWVGHELDAASGEAVDCFAGKAQAWSPDDESNAIRTFDVRTNG